MKTQPQLMTTTIKSPCFYYAHEALAAHVKPQAAQFLEGAESAMVQQDVAKATDCYKKALGLHPTSALLMVNLGTLLAEQGMAKEGIEYLQQAIKRENVGNAVAYYNLGTIMLGYGALDAAEEYLKKAQEIEKNNPNIANNLGLVEFHLKHDAQAVALFEKAFEEHPDFAYAAHNLGCLAYDRSDMRAAIDWFEKARAISPDNFATLNSLACALFLNDDVAQAIKLLYACIDSNPQYRMPFYNLGFIVYERKLLPHV